MMYLNQRTSCIVKGINETKSDYEYLLIKSEPNQTNPSTLTSNVAVSLLNVVKLPECTKKRIKSLTNNNKNNCNHISF